MCGRFAHAARVSPGEAVRSEKRGVPAGRGQSPVAVQASSTDCRDGGVSTDPERRGSGASKRLRVCVFSVLFAFIFLAPVARTRRPAVGQERLKPVPWQGLSGRLGAGALQPGVCGTVRLQGESVSPGLWPRCRKPRNVSKINLTKPCPAAQGQTHATTCLSRVWVVLVSRTWVGGMGGFQSLRGGGGGGGLQQVGGTYGQV